MKNIEENGESYSKYQNVKGRIVGKDVEPSEEIMEYWDKEKRKEQKALRQALRRLLSIAKIAKR